MDTMSICRCVLLAEAVLCGLGAALYFYLTDTLILQHTMFFQMIDDLWQQF